MRRCMRGACKRREIISLGTGRIEGREIHLKAKRNEITSGENKSDKGDNEVRNDSRVRSSRFETIPFVSVRRRACAYRANLGARG